MIIGNSVEKTSINPGDKRNENPFVLRVEKTFIDYGFQPPAAGRSRRHAEDG